MFFLLYHFSFCKFHIQFYCFTWFSSDMSVQVVTFRGRDIIYAIGAGF